MRRRNEMKQRYYPDIQLTGDRMVLQPKIKYLKAKCSNQLVVLLNTSIRVTKLDHYTPYNR